MPPCCLVKGGMSPTKAAQRTFWFWKSAAAGPPCAPPSGAFHPRPPQQSRTQSRRNLSATPLPEGRFSNIMQPMEVHFTPELEAKLTQSATQQGRNPDE